MPRGMTGDSFLNLQADLGIGANNVFSGGNYGFNPITRQHLLLEWCYRGSWIVRKTVDCPADDMTRQGIRINDDMPPDRIEQMQAFFRRKQLWLRLNSTLKWARLYGGCLAVVVIEGQKFDEPLRMDRVGKGTFRGLIVLDRWMVTPEYSKLVSDPGSEHYGDPVYYDVVADARTLPQMRIHHSRCIRIDGIELPYWQKIAENGWSLSVLEPMWDRVLAFDSATMGAAQLVYRAYLRTIKFPKFREAVATGGAAYRAVLRQIQTIRLMQSNEGLTVLDAEDSMESTQYSFAGLSDMIGQFGQQLSGSGDVPLTRMFGQSPSGLNSTGESDLENYRDGLKSWQETHLAEPMQTVCELTHRSLYGEPLPDEFGFEFAPLGQLKDADRADIATRITGAVVQAYEAQLITAFAAAKELRQMSRVTGVFTNITDEDLKELKDNPPAGPNEEEDVPGAESADGLDIEGGEHQDEEIDHASTVGALSDRLGGAVEDPDAFIAKVVKKRRTEKVATIAENHRRRQIAAMVTIRRMDQETDASAGSSPGATAPVTSSGFRDAGFTLGTGTRDAYPVREAHGLELVIETEKGAKRTGSGWKVNMPADYGYVKGTSSSEGPTEQFDCFVGPDLLGAAKAWVIEQRHPRTKAYDEGKLMLGFPSKVAAVDCYIAAFSDGLGRDRIGKVIEMPVGDVRAYLDRWPYGSPPPKLSDAQKKTKASVSYHGGAGEDRCDVCRHFDRVGSTCDLVRGKIALDGWCELFEKEGDA
jgi:phage-related protein (TIGR01555 family)